METKVVYIDERMVDVIIRVNLASLEAAIKATKNKIEGRNRRSRPLALNATQILEVKRLLAEGVTQKVIAAKFGISQPTVSNISRSAHNYDLEV